MVKIWQIMIPELTGREKRRAYLYLPKSYRRNPEKRYPVLYMFDGHNVFFDDHATYGKSWGMKDYLDRVNAEVIVAAIECNHSPDHGRLKEYSPFTFRDRNFGVITGKGKKTMDWIERYFKPLIDSRYRTLSDREHTWIAGSSMGGLMSLYAVLEYNHVFGRAAALSPSIWTDTEKILEMIKRADVAAGTVLYLDYGSEELRNHEGMKAGFAKTTAQLVEKGLMVESRIVPGGKHCEASWERQIPFFMQTLQYTEW